MDDWTVGIDLGATKVALGLIDPQNRIVARRRLPTRADDGPQNLVERIARTISELEAELPDQACITAVGICTPGPVDHTTGTLLDPPNIPALHSAPLRRMLSDRLDLPVSLEHDAKAAALGEFHYGAGRGVQSMVYIVLGTGVGAAIIIDGQLYRGVRNAACEVGHITLERGGERCSCGSRGCVATFLSGPRLALRYRRALEQRDQAQPRENVTGELVTRLAAQGDSLARQIVSKAGEALGVAVATMAMIIDIELFVVGSSVARAGDLLLEPARQTVPHHCYQSVSCRLRIETAQLWDDGPILGCGWLARQALGRQ
jgi:glucokinase